MQNDRRVVLTIDVGTTSMRGILYSITGELLYIIQKETSPNFLENNRVEQDPYIWSEVLHKILVDSVSYCAVRQAEIIGISLTAFRSPVFPVDAVGKPLYPAIMWQDKRTDELVEELRPSSDRVYDVTGLPITSVFSAVKMKWIKENCSDVYRKTHKMLGVYEYLLFLMTGKYVTDHSLASRTNLFNLIELEWDDEMLTLFGVKREHLCDLVPPGEICGSLQHDIAEIMGMPAGVPIICGGGDQQCAALGLGVIEKSQVAVNTGTGAYAIGLSDKPVFDPKRKIYCNVSAIAGKYIAEAGMLTGGTIYRWMSEVFLPEDMNAKAKFPILNYGAENSPPGSRGVVVIPRFKGVAGSSSKLKGCFLNLDLHTDLGDMARAVMEGIAFEQKDNIKCISELTSSINEVFVSGGLTQADLFNQIQADIYERNVISFSMSEATSLGAWINGVIALGCYSSYYDVREILQSKDKKLFTPSKKNRKLYRDIHEMKRKIVEAMENVDN